LNGLPGWIASVTGFSYSEINIIAYCNILPFIYAALIDRILHKHILKIVYVLAWIGILCFVRDFAAFSKSLFASSVDFLLNFSPVGLDYVSASVVICVILPGIAFVLLMQLDFLLISQHRQTSLPDSSHLNPSA